MEDDVPLIEKLSVLNGLLGTKHINEWESIFIHSVVPVAIARAKIGQVMGLTRKQLDVIDRIYERVA